MSDINSQKKKGQTPKKVNAKEVDALDLEPKIRKRTKLTVQQPFELKGEELSAIAKARLKEAQLQKEKEEAEAREFRAKEPASLGSPFALKPSQFALTVPQSPELQSTERAEARHDYDNEANRRREEKKLRKEAELAQIAKEEEAEALELRKKMVFKARPFVEPEPMVVRKSARPLTVPKSPLVRQRGKTR